MGQVMSLCDSYQIDPEDKLQLEVETGFNKSTLARLERRFKYLDKGNKGYLSKRDLMSISEVANNPIGERLLNSFFPIKRLPNGSIDAEESEKLHFYDFAKNFAAFRQVSEKDPCKNISNSKEHKLKFLFDLIDQNHDGHFSRVELYDLLEMMLGAKVSLDQIVYIVDRVVAEADKDGDGVISFQEFKDAVGDLDIEAKMAFVGFK